MSTFTVPVVRIERLEKHPNAETLSVTSGEGCPCVIRTGDLNVGDLAVYIPVESVVKEGKPWVAHNLGFLKFKNGLHRVKAVRLRGIFSMGILLPLAQLTQDLLHEGGRFKVIEGQDLKDVLGIVKYEEPEDQRFNGGVPCMNTGRGSKVPDPGYMPVYDMESFRKFGQVFQDGEEVVVTEKIHGCNARFIHDGEKLWVGSHRTWKLVGEEDVWNTIATKYGLAEKLAAHPMVGIYGEVYGDVQDLKYGMGQNEIGFRVFDAYAARPFVENPTGERRPAPARHLDFDDLVAFTRELGLEMVPVLYIGPFDRPKVESLADGNTTLGGKNVREGAVIKTRFESWCLELGRKQTKLVSEAYLLRKGGTEAH